MRGRPKRKRFVEFSPEVTYLKPVGIPLRNLQIEILSLDEFEAIRLYDFVGLEQEEASKKMKISRTTFLRVLHSAHTKIAKSLVYGRAIKVKGGDIVMRGKRLGMGRGFGSIGTNECVCPKCGEKIPHKRGIPCSQILCPKCKTPMAGEYCR